MQLQVMNSPFNEEQIELLNRLLPVLTEAQRIWLTGYLTALNGKGSASVHLQEAIPTDNTNSTAVKPQSVTILYGSQTGNGQELAEDLEQQLQEKNFEVTLSSMSDFKSNTFKKIQNLLIIVSTHGEGDPPDTALPFYEILNGRRAPRLENVQYSVLSLGDSSYEFFCQTGKELDERLEELGAKRLHPRVDCDLDFDEDAAQWFAQVLDKLSDVQKAHLTQTESASSQLIEKKKSAYSRTNPFQAEVFENVNLNGRGSNKKTHHLELSLEGSGLQFEPGDSLGVYPENDPVLVDKLIDEMGWDREELVVINKQGEKRELRAGLLNHFEITVLTKPLLKQLAAVTANEPLQTLIESEQKMRNYLIGRDLLDLVKDYAFKEVSVSTFIPLLRKLPARLYSVASSYEANQDEVHLTIGAVEYEAHGRERGGVCSLQCAERVQPGDFLPIYVQRNANFKLPAESETPIIMIGPGTGIAPFRAFLEEREEIDTKGEAWLFFGDQHFVTDFLYQTEWQRWLKDGILTKMDVAFSRDTQEKVYVQHRMLEKSKELYEWLEKGAVVYVCGDEKKMAKDVHTTLLIILEREGKLSSEEAAVYLSDMRQQKRYQRDVY